MVREILQISVGNCGNLIGYDFWNNISFEHNLNSYGNCTHYDNARMEKLDTYFIETASQSYKPRSIMVDLDTQTLDMVRASPIRNMFQDNNFKDSYNISTSHNWGAGHYRIGSEIINEIGDCIRSKIETCDALQGFQILHSLGGGTGSGLGTLILLHVRDYYPDRVTSTYSVFPTSQPEIAMAPYNVVLSMHQIIELSDYSIMLDNQALFHVAKNILKLQTPNFSDLNWLISLAMNGCTAPLRYRGTWNDDLRKRCVNLVPFPRLHFFICSHAPFFTNAKEGSKLKLETEDLTDQVWSAQNMLLDVDPKDGKFLTSLCVYRRNLVDLDLNYKIIYQFLRENKLDDKISLDIINLFLKYYTYGNDKGVIPDFTELFKSKNRSKQDFVTWLPDNNRTSFIECPPHNTSQSATLISNTSAVANFFQRFVNEFNALFDKQSMLHLYTNEGMDVMELQEACKNVRDLITEYNDKQDARVWWDDYDDEDDSEEYENERNYIERNYINQFDEDYNERNYINQFRNKNKNTINYNMDVVNQLMSLGIGNENDIKKAMNNVVNANDINEVADYLYNQH